MNHQETLALLKQGKEAWNTWAEAMLKERAELEAEGQSLDGWQSRARAELNCSTAPSKLDLSNLVFPGKSVFQGEFRGEAKFENAVFNESAKFFGVHFGPATFTNATFKGEANFRYAQFMSVADFSRCTFAKNADFEGAKFNKHARFDECKFVVGAKFLGAIFKTVDFSGASANDFLDFARCDFLDQAKFTAIKVASADFPLTKFARGADFAASTFDGVLLFTRAEFLSDAEFGESIFTGHTDFTLAKFAEAADFNNCEFQLNTNFIDCQFENEAIFFRCDFGHLTRFDRSQFRGDTSFGRCKFEDITSFEAIRAETTFDLSDSRYRYVPNFIQAHFPEAPILDAVNIPTVKQLAQHSDFREPQLTAAYRALKRLAIQGHDHERELQFFADEMRSQLEERWKLKSLLIALYGHFSDFGRSILRPSAWWSVLFLLFGGLYYLGHRGWLLESWHSACVSGNGSPLLNAIYLSLRKGLIFPGLSQTGKIDQVNACLFGFQTFATKDGVRRVVPDIPLEVAFLGMAQTLFSGILIFLVLLAVRNRFRVK